MSYYHLCLIELDPRPLLVRRESAGKRSGALRNTSTKQGHHHWLGCSLQKIIHHLEHSDPISNAYHASLWSIIHLDFIDLPDLAFSELENII